MYRFGNTISFELVFPFWQISQGEEDNGAENEEEEEDDGGEVDADDPPSRASSSPGSDGDYEIISHGDLQPTATTS